MMDENASLVRIERAAFAKCTSLRFFDIPMKVESIGHNCFKKCFPLSQLKFASGDSLRKVVGEMGLDEAMYHFGLNETSSVLSIEIGRGGVNLEFSGWSSVVTENSQIALLQPH
jgi:hypothetical protein